LTAIVGPNGAGKTTYFNLISGQLPASKGRVLLDSQELTSLSASARTRAGLGRAFQLTNLFPNLTVLENVRLAVQATEEGAHLRGLNMWSIWQDHAKLTQQAQDILVQVAMMPQAHASVASLPHGDQRKLEVALLMALKPSVYMFDEPTAGMSQDEAPVILNLIRQLKSDKTKTILLVEHKMDVVRELADRIVVLHNGQLVADGEVALGFQQLSELIHVPGITIVGPLPDAVAIDTIFSGAVVAGSAQAQAVQQLLAFMACEAAAAAKHQQGMAPAAVPATL
jgi:branched-chain amino acid transport system ATP-binding protein